MLPENKILDKLTKNGFYKKVREKKWAERKQAFNKMIIFHGEPPILCPLENLLPLLSEIKLVLTQDSNMNVNIAAIYLLTALLSGSISDFHKFLFIELDLVMNKYKDKQVTMEKAVNSHRATYLTSLDLSEFLEPQ